MFRRRVALVEEELLGEFQWKPWDKLEVPGHLAELRARTVVPGSQLCSPLHTTLHQWKLVFSRRQLALFDLQN